MTFQMSCVDKESFAGTISKVMSFIVFFPNLYGILEKGYSYI